MPNAAELAVTEQQEFYRLLEPVTSPGDIFEVDVSCRAIYIGPLSDIAEVNVQYADARASLGARNAIVSVNGPWTTRLDVNLNERISSTGQPQRILVSPVDIVDLAYQRPTAGPAPSRRFAVPPQLDLIFSLNPPQAIPEVRADRTLRLPQVPYGLGADSTDVAIPIYGRRMVSFQFTTAQEFSASFYLVALQPGLNQTPKFLGTISQALAADVRTSTVVFRASDQVADVTDTDVPPLVYTAAPLPAAKGQADLIIVNISRAGAVVGDQYVDLFVKLSDREA